MVRPRINIRTNAKEVIERAGTRFKFLRKGLKTSVRDAAQYAKTTMYNLAPFDTGKTARAISWTQGNRDASATVIIREGHANRVGQIKGKYGLTGYMNYGATDLSHWRTGEPHFIEKGKELTRMKLGKKVRTILTGALKK